MALKIRLARGGAKKRPYYRIVVAQATAPRDGRFIEKVGTYNPMLKSEDPSRVTLEVERVKYWLSVGAQPTDRVVRFLGNAGLMTKQGIVETPSKSAPKKKAQERMKEEAAAIEAAKAAAEAEKAAAKAAAEAPAPVVEEAAAEEAQA